MVKPEERRAEGWKVVCGRGCLLVWVTFLQLSAEYMGSFAVGQHWLTCPQLS